MPLVSIHIVIQDQLLDCKGVLSANSLLNRNRIRRWDLWPLGCPPTPLLSQSSAFEIQPVCVYLNRCLKKAKFALILILGCTVFCNYNVSNVLLESCTRQKSASAPSLCCYRDKAPGQRECDHSIDSINKCIRDIEQASLAAVGQSLPCRDDISLEVLKCISPYVICLLVFFIYLFILIVIRCWKIFVSFTVYGFVLLLKNRCCSSFVDLAQCQRCS